VGLNPAGVTRLSVSDSRMLNIEKREVAR
jgi:hypothetical protein